MSTSCTRGAVFLAFLPDNSLFSFIGMAKQPRKSNPPSEDPTLPFGGQFADDLEHSPVPPDPATADHAVPTQQISASVEEEWDLDDGGRVPIAPTPARPRVGNLPVGPIHSSPVALPPNFESNGKVLENPRDLEPGPLPRAAPSDDGPRKVGMPIDIAIAKEPDPFDIEEDLPPVVAPPPREKVTVTSPVSVVSAPEEETLPSARRSLKPAAAAADKDRLGMLVGALILIGLLAIFGGVLYANRPASNDGGARTSPRLPLNGQLISLSGISTGWRTRAPGDLVSAVDIALPAPSRQQPNFLPNLQITLDPAATKSGYLRIIFLDLQGKISGDVRVIKFTGSTIEPLNSGAKVTGPGTASIYGSAGFMDRSSFMSYAGSDGPRWSVEISESSEYNAKEAAWNPLDHLEILHSNAQ
jgi:hypothetical protein